MATRPPAGALQSVRSNDPRLWLIVAVGLAIRLGLAVAFHGTNHVDIEGYVARSVRSWDWHAAYESGLISWTYPPLFTGWLAGASWLSDVSALPFHTLAKLGPVLADVGIALAVHSYLGWRGANRRTCLSAAALVMLGPSFFAISGYHGQIDAVAILPAVLALSAWERRPKGRRAVEAGLLLGVGAAVKTVPILMLPTLVAYSRSRTEAGKVVGSALLPPALVLVPLWLSGVDLHQVFSYTGVPGFGGLSLVADPALGWHELTVNIPFQYSNDLTVSLLDASRWITLGVLFLHFVFVRRARPAVVDAVALLWIAVYAFSPNFFLNYVVWGLPFFLMAGYLREVALLQLALLLPTVAYYVSLWPDRSEVLGFAYVPIMIAVWAAWVVAGGLLVARMTKRGSDSPGENPPLVDLAAGGS